jgi:hypothetical protein
MIQNWLLAKTFLRARRRSGCLRKLFYGHESAEGLGSTIFRSMLIADRYCSRHADAMGRQPAERLAPDQFPTATDSASPAPKATTETTPQRYVLPKNLRNAVKYLSDGELDLMHTATVEELKRRGRMPKSAETDLPASPDLTKSPATTAAKLNAAENSLTRGQVNAVQSAFRAGITPSRIAREFGIPLSDVRQALARDKTKR